MQLRFEHGLPPLRTINEATPAPLEALVMRCLARDPRFRPASAGEVAAALAEEPAAADLPTLVAQTKPLPARVMQTVPGRSAWLWIAAAAVVAVIGLVLGLANLGGGGSLSQPPQRTAQTVAGVPQGATAAEEARNLSAWLRSHSR
jgi:hypothetical protein